MARSIDTVLISILVIAMGILSIINIRGTEVGNITSGWTSGTYQRGYEDRFEKAGPIRSFSADLWAAFRWAVLSEAAQGAIVGQGGWMFTAEEFQEPADAPNFEKTLTNTMSTLGDAGISLVPVIVPDKARMLKDRLPALRSQGFVDRYENALSTIAGLDLTVIDAREALAKGDSFLMSDTHWSPTGAQRVADLIAVALAETDMARVSVSTQQTGTIRYKGDLVAFADTGRFADRIGPKPMVLPNYETLVVSEDLGLFGDAAVDVALVGTSFSARQEFHFEGFLKAALSADLVSYAQVGLGPFEPMQRFLETLPTLQSPPKIVVWEIPERYLSVRNQ